jgi:hypothetical protein
VHAYAKRQLVWWSLVSGSGSPTLASEVDMHEDTRFLSLLMQLRNAAVVFDQSCVFECVVAVTITAVRIPAIVINPQSVCCTYAQWGTDKHVCAMAFAF